MNKKHLSGQRKFFNIKKHQYNSYLILHPPTHTLLEINYFLKKIPNNAKDDVILDFGAGTGRITIPLLREGFSVWAVDISERSLYSLREIARSLSLYSLKTFTSLPKKTFKTIVGADVLHHVDLDNYLPILYKSLKRQGKVIFSEPGGFNPSWYIYLPIFYDWRVERGVKNCTYHNLKNKFKKYGFEDVRITGFGFLPRPFFSWSKSLCRFNDWLGKILVLNLFAYRYIIEATKI